jgi:hypothetical protein
MPLVGPSPSPQPSADPSPPPTTTPPRRPRPRRPPRPGRRRRPAATGAAAAPRGRGGPGGGGGRGGRPPTTTRSVDPTAAPPPDQAGAARLRAPIYADPLLSSRTVCLSPPVVAGMHNCPCSHGYSDLVQNYFSNYQPNVAHAEIWSAGNRAALESAAISAVRSSKSGRLGPPHTRPHLSSSGADLIAAVDRGWAEPNPHSVGQRASTSVVAGVSSSSVPSSSAESRPSWPPAVIRLGAAWTCEERIIEEPRQEAHAKVCGQQRP